MVRSLISRALRLAFALLRFFCREIRCSPFALVLRSVSVSMRSPVVFKIKHLNDRFMHHFLVLSLKCATEVNAGVYPIPFHYLSHPFWPSYASPSSNAHPSVLQAVQHPYERKRASQASSEEVPLVTICDSHTAPQQSRYTSSSPPVASHRVAVHAGSQEDEDDERMRMRMMKIAIYVSMLSLMTMAKIALYAMMRMAPRTGTPLRHTQTSADFSRRKGRSPKACRLCSLLRPK